MKYKIFDKVECAYGLNQGGSLGIEITFDKIVEKEYVLKIIDILDHCFITNDENLIKYSQRFILLKKNKNLFEDISFILKQFLKFKKITINLGKETFSKKYNEIGKNKIIIWHEEIK